VKELSTKLAWSTGPSITWLRNRTSGRSVVTFVTERSKMQMVAERTDRLFFMVSVNFCCLVVQEAVMVRPFELIDSLVAEGKEKFTFDEARTAPICRDRHHRRQPQ
jgi:hypothetical protein